VPTPKEQWQNIVKNGSTYPILPYMFYFETFWIIFNTSSIKKIKQHLTMSAIQNQKRNVKFQTKTNFVE